MRIMRSQAQWQAIIEDQQTRGLAIMAYGQDNNIHYPPHPLRS